MTPEQITRCMIDHERIQDIAGDLAGAKDPFADMVVEYITLDNHDIIVQTTRYYRGGHRSLAIRVPIAEVSRIIARNDRA